MYNRPIISTKRVIPWITHLNRIRIYAFTLLYLDRDMQVRLHTYIVKSRQIMGPRKGTAMGNKQRLQILLRPWLRMKGRAIPPRINRLSPYES